MAAANNEFFEALSMLEHERGITAEYLIEKIKAAIVIAVKKNYEVEDDNVLVEIDPDSGKFNVALVQNVVADEDWYDEHAEIGITEAALYHYISSKDDLLNMVLSECYDTPDADEYNAVTAAVTDNDGHRVYFYPRYCLNIALYNLQRPELVQLYSVLNGEALSPTHPAHNFFIGRHMRNWEMICSMNWILPTGVDEERFYDLYTLAMSAMDGLQYRWLGDDSMNLLEEWMSISDIIFPPSEWAGFTDPSEYDPAPDRCLLPFTLSARQ